MEKKSGLSVGPRFDSGRNPVNSNQYGFEQIDPQARVPQLLFPVIKANTINNYGPSSQIFRPKTQILFSAYEMDPESNSFTTD